MPRKARINAPGALHHIIARGIERRSIFEDDTDRKDFLNGLDTVLSETQTACYAWAHIPIISTFCYAQDHRQYQSTVFDSSVSKKQLLILSQLKPPDRLKVIWPKDTVSAAIAAMKPICGLISDRNRFL